MVTELLPVTSAVPWLFACRPAMVEESVTPGPTDEGPPDDPLPHAAMTRARAASGATAPARRMRVLREVAVSLRYTRQVRCQFNVGSAGQVATAARGQPWRRSTPRHSASGSTANTSSGRLSTTYHAPSATSASNWPAAHPE